MILDNDYKIECEDDKNVNLLKKRIIEKSKDPEKIGTIDWDVVGYYPNIKQALKRYCNIQLNNSLDNITSVLKKYDELMNKIDNLEVNNVKT